jgi:uncharacterized protein
MADGSGMPRRRPSRNVLGEILVSCSERPLTGFFRDGCCNTGPEDAGSHTVCAVMTADFLAFRSWSRRMRGFAELCRT